MKSVEDSDGTERRLARDDIDKIERVCDEIMETDIPIQGSVGDLSPRKRHKYVNQWTASQRRVLGRIQEIESVLTEFDEK